MGPHPAVAAIRLAVRRVLHDVLNEHSRDHQSAAAGRDRGSPRRPRRRLRTAARAPRARGLLAAAPTPWRSPPPSPSKSRKLSLRAGGITVDHGLQHGSDLRAAEVVSRMTRPRPRPRRGGRRARGPRGRSRGRRPGRPLRRAGRRGRAPRRRRRSCSATPATTRRRPCCSASPAAPAPAPCPAWPPSPGPAGRYRRPFLELDRQTARKACMVQALPVWDDPHNADPAYTRSRLRQEGLPALEKALGKGVVEALARTAQLSRDDADALDAWAVGRPTRPYGTTPGLLDVRQAVRAAARRAPPHRAPRGHRGGLARRFALRPPRRGGRPADHQLARPAGHQSPGPRRRASAGWQTGHSAGLSSRT